jgi:hypothetical protein
LPRRPGGPRLVVDVTGTLAAAPELIAAASASGSRELG